MRRFFYLPALILLYLLTTAKSCDDQAGSDEKPGEKRLTAVTDSIRSTFSVETLSDASLRAFEIAAMNKLSDLGDYQAIVSDTAVALPFREKAQEMVRKLFISEETANALAGNIADSVWVQQPLQRTGNLTYSGKLGFTCYPEGQAYSHIHSRVRYSGSIDFSVVKREKVFGTDSLLIWDVFLGKSD